MRGEHEGWLRFYVSILSKPKVMLLEPELFRVWVLLLLLCKREGLDGYLPDMETVAFALHNDADRCQIALDRLVIARLIDKEKGGPSGYRFRMHDWDDWQYKSDTSTERTKRFRERSQTVPRARASSEKTRVEQSRAERAGAREPASPDFEISNSSKSEQKIGGLRPMLEPPEEPELPPQVGNGSAQHEQSEFLLERIVANYERSLAKAVPRSKVAELWWQLSPAEHVATAEGFLVWLIENSPKVGEPHDPKFVKGLDKLLEEGTLAKRKIGPPELDRFGRPMADIRPKVLAAWLIGETYGQSQI